MEERVRELAAARRRFVMPALALFVLWLGTFLVLMGYAHEFMRTRVVGAFTWAYVLALSIIVLVWAIAFAYLRYAESTLAPLAERRSER